MKKALFFTRESTLAMAVFLAIGFAAISYATPSWMDIGMYYITQAEGGTDGTPNANNFYNGAVAHHPNGPAPYLYVNAPGKQANFTAVTTQYQREICDFLFFPFHGQPRCMWVWNDAGTGMQAYTPTDYHFGTSYVRWVYLNSCSVLQHGDPNFWSGWDPAFRGVQAILGFGIDLPIAHSPDIPTYFWEYWAATTNQMNMWDAFHEASRRALYLEGGLNSLPTIISSCRPSNPYYYYWEDTYNSATSEKGVEDPRSCIMGYVGP